MYVQGMNVVCAVFLYVMPELDAFHCFEALIKQHCAAYFIRNSVTGAIRVGCDVYKVN